MTVEAAVELPLGDVVAERYEILEVVGRGATGTVYRARDLYLDSGREIVALKAIHPRLLDDRQVRGRFRREAAILKRLEGPNICPLFDWVDDGETLLIALEYVDGPSLDEYLAQRGILPIAEVLAIMQQVCAGVQTAHDAGVVHRDLKPSNVLIEGLRSRVQGQAGPASFLGALGAKVVDFGLAKVLLAEPNGTMLTEQDMIFGTPDYMAPEQVAGEALGPACDVYAAGVMLFELVTGGVPFQHNTPIATMTAHLHEAIPSIAARAPAGRQVPAKLERCILKALAKEPSQRFESVAELAASLAEMAGQGFVNEDTVADDVSVDPSTVAADPEAGNADAGNADAGNADAGNADAGNADAGNADAGNADGATLNSQVEGSNTPDTLVDEALLNVHATLPSQSDDGALPAPLEHISAASAALERAGGRRPRTAGASWDGRENLLWLIAAVVCCGAAVAFGIVLGGR